MILLEKKNSFIDLKEFHYIFKGNLKYPKKDGNFLMIINDKKWYFSIDKRYQQIVLSFNVLFDMKQNEYIGDRFFNYYLKDMSCFFKNYLIMFYEFDENILNYSFLISAG